MELITITSNGREMDLNPALIENVEELDSHGCIVHMASGCAHEADQSRKTVATRVRLAGQDHLPPVGAQG